MEFKCGYCGKEFKTISERTRCEMRCGQKEKQNQEPIKQKEFEREKENNKNEILALQKQEVELRKLIKDKTKAYVKKYQQYIPCQNDNFVTINMSPINVQDVLNINEISDIISKILR